MENFIFSKITPLYRKAIFQLSGVAFLGILFVNIITKELGILQNNGSFAAIAALIWFFLLRVLQNSHPAFKRGFFTKKEWIVLFIMSGILFPILIKVLEWSVFKSI